MLPLLAFLALASPQDCHNFGTVSTCTTSLPPSQPCGWCEKTHDGVPKCEACAAGPGCDKPSASWSACSQSAANVTLPPSPSPLPSAWVPNYYLHIETGMDVAKSALSCGFDQFDYESAEKVDVACTCCRLLALPHFSASCSLDPPLSHSLLPSLRTGFACGEWCADASQSMAARVSSILNQAAPGTCAAPSFSCANTTLGAAAGTHGIVASCAFQCTGLWALLLRNKFWIAIIEAGTLAIVVAFIACICAPICFVAVCVACCGACIAVCVASRRHKLRNEESMNAPHLISLNFPEEGTAGSRDPWRDEVNAGGSLQTFEAPLLSDDAEATKAAGGAAAAPATQ